MSDDIESRWKGMESLHQLISDRLEDASNDYETSLATKAIGELAAVCGRSLSIDDFMSEEDEG